jgi:HEAT repeat protein
MSRSSIPGAGLVGLVLLCAPGFVRADGSYLGKRLEAWAADLRSNDPAARRGAAFALGKMASTAKDALPQLLKILGTDKVPAVREAAAFSIGEIARGANQAEAQSELVHALTAALAKDPDYRVRRSAAVALGGLGPKGEAALPALEIALDDQRPEVRQNVAWALGKIGGKCVPALRRALADRDPLVVRDAANSVGRCREAGHAALPELLLACRHSDSEARKAAVAALVGMVTPLDRVAYEPLTQLLNDPDLEARNNAALALGNMGGEGAKAAVPVLVRAFLQKADPELRQQAAAVLMNIGPAAQAALAPLREALGDPDLELRHNVAVALGGLGTAAAPAFDDLIKVLADSKEDAEVRVAAATALARVGNAMADAGNGPKQKYIQDLVPLLAPGTSDKVRERTLWVLRLYPKELASHQDVFEAMVRIASTPRERIDKMLRYDAAFMLGVFWRQRTPKVGLDVLLDFLNDDHIKIFTGTSVSTTIVDGIERQPGKAIIVDQGEGDGRVMAVRALRRIGPEVVSHRQDIMRQLRALRNSPDARMQTELKSLFEEFGQ